MLLAALVILVISVLTISFLCSITEAVLLSLNPLQLRLEHSKGAKGAGRWLALKQHIERPISAILIFNTTANTGLATLAGAIFIQRFSSEWLWLFTFILTVAILFGGEMAPKILGVHHARRLAGSLLQPLEWMLWFGHPLVILMDRFCERLKPKSPAKSSASDHIMDIITLVQAAKAEQAIHNREEIILIHAATLSARRVKSVMVPGPAVRVFDMRKSFEENIRDAGGKIHRSYPVTADGTLATIKGYIRVRDLFVSNLLQPQETDWQKLIRPVLNISDQASLTQLLAAFLENREIAAIVNSSEATNTGWITLDDVTETLMGARG